MYNQPMDYLSLCLVCKDENNYLAEWLNYHILMGVERFYIYDNDSQIPVRDTLKDYVRQGVGSGTGYTRQGDATSRLRPLFAHVWREYVLDGFY